MLSRRVIYPHTVDNEEELFKQSLPLYQTENASLSVDESPIFHTITGRNSKPKTHVPGYVIRRDARISTLLQHESELNLLILGRERIPKQTPASYIPGIILTSSNQSITSLLTKQRNKSNGKFIQCYKNMSLWCHCRSGKTSIHRNELSNSKMDLQISHKSSC